jgi:hypothetical protein
MASAPACCRDIDDLADDLGEIWLSDLIGNRKDESGSNPAPIRDRLDSSSSYNVDVVGVLPSRQLRDTPEVVSL